ncbi:hypothetical protein DENSPDRAFT_928083 [Dentipellis sp. KUC8613]|nr:hypothetical protein DENSPDRAFT_928083 [Dentipellis sp. KUC8613]
MNGPPTPPAEDQPLPAEQAPAPAATSDAPAAVEVAPDNQLPSPEQSPYYQIFPQIASLAAKGEIQELIELAERADLNGVHDTHPSRLFVTAPLVLGYLIRDEVPPARFALTRLPNSIAVLPLSQALFGVLASTSERKYENVYTRAERLYEMTQASDFPDADLASVISGLTTNFVESFRRRTFALISKAYTSIPLALAQSYLGLPRDQLLAAAESSKWAYDASADVLTPPPASAERPHLNGFVSTPSTLLTFDLVTDSVARLEV